jgi:hypothetical protein
MNRMTTSCLLAALALAAASTAQQVADPDYAPPIEQPQYESGRGPKVVIDAAHRNFHTAEDRYAPFAALLRRDGYRVESGTKPFAAQALASIDILVISNAMHEQSSEAAGWAPLPNYSAFTDQEIVEVEKWVRGGGSLLLIADHMPLAGHAEALAAAFGVRFQNGFALDSRRTGQITFRRSDGSLAPGVIADARGDSARVDFVTTFTGQAFRVDPSIDAEPLLIVPSGYDLLLPTVAFEFSEGTPRIPAVNLLQGALVRHGNGKLAVFGEAAMFSAQLAGPERRPMGMNAPDARENYRYALNVLHWLSGALK